MEVQVPQLQEKKVPQCRFYRWNWNSYAFKQEIKAKEAIKGQFRRVNESDLP